MLPEVPDIASLHALYEAGASPLDLADALAARLAASCDTAIFITAVDRDELGCQATELSRRAPALNSLPLRACLSR